MRYKQPDSNQCRRSCILNTNERVGNTKRHMFICLCVLFLITNHRFYIQNVLARVNLFSLQKQAV